MTMNYDYLTSAVQVCIPSFKENKSDSSAVYFTIQLSNKQNKWYVQKRFSQFDGLFKSIKSAYHNVPTLPNKNFLFKMSQKDLQNRKKGLQEFLQKIVVRNDLMNSQQVKSFLQLDKNASQMMVNPPKLLLEYSIEGQSKGIRDFIYVQEQNMFYLATADTNSMSKLNAKVTNTKLPWQNQGKSFMEVGTVQAWAAGDGNDKFIKIWSKGYPKEATAIHFDKASNRVLVGLDDGVIDVIQISGNGYEDVSCVKCHQGRITGLSYDALNNCVYSVATDKVFRISHGSSLAMIIGLPHKDPIFCMYRDTLNKRMFFGTKNGQIFLYDISQAQKPKIMTTLQNNKKGSIRSIYMDQNRNYLFSTSYDDGQLNVFDLDKPGREKYAKMNATLRGKQKVRNVAWAPKRAQIISGNDDGSITFWNAVQGKSIYVLQSFNNSVTGLHYIEEKQTIITTSKGKLIKIWQLPKQWRDAKLVADERKLAGQRINQYNKQKVSNAVKKAQQDSDDDDLAGWHLD